MFARTKRFQPSSSQERREWIAARLKERWSRYPQYAGYTDLDWHRIAPIGSEKMLEAAVLDPGCLLLPTPPQWFGSSR